MWSVYSGYLYEGVFSEKCIAPGIEVEKQSQVLEEKLAERCKLAKGRPCVDFKVVDVNGKEGMFSDYVKPGKYNMLEVWALWPLPGGNSTLNLDPLLETLYGE